MRVYRGLRGALLVMTSRDPELTLGAELRNTAYQLQVYRALAFATNDAHGTLDVMLSASNPDVDRRPLQQDESPAMKAIAATRLLKCTHSR